MKKVSLEDTKPIEEFLKNLNKKFGKKFKEDPEFFREYIVAVIQSILFNFCGNDIMSMVMFLESIKMDLGFRLMMTSLKKPANPDDMRYIG